MFKRKFFNREREDSSDFNILPPPPPTPRNKNQKLALTHFLTEFLRFLQWFQKWNIPPPPLLLCIVFFSTPSNLILISILTVNYTHWNNQLLWCQTNVTERLWNRRNICQIICWNSLLIIWFWNAQNEDIWCRNSRFEFWLLAGLLCQLNSEYVIGMDI